MRFVYATVAGFVTGYITTVLVAPKSGKETRNDINRRSGRPVKNTKLFLNKLAYKTGLISKKRKAELNKAAVESFNARFNSVKNENNHSDMRGIEQYHQKSGAPNSISNRPNQSTIRKVPANTK